MKNSILIALFGIAVIAAVPANASTSGFDFTQCSTGSNHYGVSQTESSTCGSAGYSNTSNSFSQTVTGITVTATAYTTAAGGAGTAGTAISSGTNAAVGQYTGNGIGVCSVGDPGYSTSNPGGGCNSPDHQVDDNGSHEFVLFTFSTAVDLSNITLANFGGGSLNALGVSFWVDPSSLTTIPAAATTVTCGGSEPSCPTVEGNGGDIGVGSWTTNNLNLTNVKTLLVGAETGETNDYFKIQGLSGVSNFVTATPEPATFGLFGFALAGIGLLARKRKSR